MLSIILCSLIFVGVCISIYRTYKKAEKEVNDLQEFNRKWLENEKTQPKFRLRIILHGTKDILTPYFEPYIGPASNYTSRRVALGDAETILASGYLNGNTIIPPHAISKIELEVET